MRWKTATLGEVCDIQAGGTPKRTDPSFWNGDVPWVKISDMLQGRITETDECISEKGLKGSAAKLLPEGTLLVSIFATIGRTASLGISAATNQAIVGVIPKEKDTFAPRFLEYCLEKGAIDLQRQARGVAQANINGSVLQKLEIPLTPLAEQKRIAKILDAADTLRRQRRQALAELDTFLQSTFLDLFGDPVTNTKDWPMGCVGDLMESVNYGTSSKANESGEGYPILRMNNITYTGAWNFDSLKYIDLTSKDLPKYLVHKGQLLFNRTNSRELVGKTAVYRQDEPMAFAGYLVRGIVNKNNHPEYVGAFMNTPQVKQHLKNMCKNIVGMANINAKEFQKIPIPKPPLDLQQHFAKIVTKVEEQKTRMREQLTELDDLFAALQQRAFNGEL